MLKRKCKILLSLVLVLSIIIVGVCYADSVYVAGAPTNNVGGYTQSVTSASQQAAASSGQRLYPGSIGNVNDAPITSTITSPASNNSKISGGVNGGTSAVITNGFTWETDTNTQEPVTKEITSPAAHQAEMKSNSNGIIGQVGYDNMGYVAPGGSSQTTNYSGSGATTTTGYQYPQSGSSTLQGSASTGQVNTGVISGFNMHNIGIANPVINSDGAIVVNASTREIYYAKNPTKVYAPAGLTTLLTGYILLQYKGLNDVMAVTQTAVTGLESGANTVGLKTGDTITVKDALYALYIKSACDVAKVIAENVAGSEQAFVNIMNQTAASWGCTSTYFANCNGLNSASQVTTPYDMAIIMSNVIQNATLNQIMQTPSYTLPATAHRKAMGITTKNEFINPSKSNYYQGVICSRMGYTSKAKYTMGSFMIHNNQYLIAIVLYSNNTQYVDSKRLLNFARIAVDTLGLSQPASFAQANVASMQNGTSNALSAQTNLSTMQSGGANGDTIGVWMQDNKGWYFLKNNNTKATNEWVQTNGKKYCVDSNGYMITGWREFSNGAIYYFNPSNGELRTSTWVNTSTGAYYLQADGTLARANKGQTKTISTQVGNYVIDENGKAIQKV